MVPQFFFFYWEKELTDQIALKFFIVKKILLVQAFAGFLSWSSSWVV